MRNRWVLSAACLVLCVSACGQDVKLQGLTDGNYRFKDMGGQVYAQSYVSSYSYPTANVIVTLDRPGLRYLAGNVAATGLKPNFAYQIKLTGNPSKSGMADADDATNEVLGFLGRWWRISPNPANSSDADYNANKDTPGYVFEGYVLIAFFVTDAQGNANARFEGNNSFHVLWRTDQRAPGANDGPPAPVSIPDTAGNAAYDAAIAARSYGLYGEWEPTRALPGALAMPDGHYRCRMFLTEESFHDTGALAGQWAVAMSAPLEFDIPTGSTPPPPDQTPARPLSVTRLHATLNLAHGQRDRAWLRGTLELPEGFEPANLEVQANVMGAARTFVLTSAGAARTREGWMALGPARAGSRTMPFRLHLNGAAFVLPPNTGQQRTVQADISVKLGAEEYAGTITVRQRLGKRRGVLSFNGDNMPQ